MNIRAILLVLVFLSLFVETTFISFPLLLTFSIIAYIFYPETKIIILTFLAAMILDFLKLSGGLTALSLVISYVLVEGSKKVFEVKDLKFIFPFLLLSTYAFAKYSSYDPGILNYLVLYGFVVLVFLYFSRKYSW